jgi:putative ABC transport system permease protein
MITGYLFCFFWEVPRLEARGKIVPLNTMRGIVAENIQMAFKALAGQLLRTVITILIIGFGIMSLVGMLTAIDVLKQSINTTFAAFGSNSFTIQNKEFWQRGGQKQKPHPAITFEQAKQFKERFSFPSVVSISSVATRTGIVKSGSLKTHPKIMVMGVDEEYLEVAGFKLKKGRNFSQQEIQQGSPVAIIGQDIAKTLFKDNTSIQKAVWVGKVRLKVIGEIEEKGAGGGMSNDRQLFVPLRQLQMYFAGDRASYVVTGRTNSAALLDEASSEAIGLFRSIRKDIPGEEDSFEIEKSTGLVGQVLGMTTYLRLGAFAVALITLLGAMVGLLNIMLVSVTERTREIGVRKSLGATRRSIAQQFLIEAIVITQIGGVVGVILGLGLGNLVSIFLGGTFLIPWNWIVLAFLVCFITGIGAGLYPALKAAKMNPVDSLRYE